MAECWHCKKTISTCISYTENKVVASCRIEDDMLIEDGQVFTNVVNFRCPECGGVLFEDGQTEELTKFLRGD